MPALVERLEEEQPAQAATSAHTTTVTSRRTFAGEATCTPGIVRIRRSNGQEDCARPIARTSDLHRRGLAFVHDQHRERDPVRDTELAIDPREVVLDGLQSQPEAIGNLLIGAAAREECR